MKRYNHRLTFSIWNKVRIKVRWVNNIVLLSFKKWQRVQFIYLVYNSSFLFKITIYEKAVYVESYFIQMDIIAKQHRQMRLIARRMIDAVNQLRKVTRYPTIRVK